DDGKHYATTHDGSIVVADFATGAVVRELAKGERFELSPDRSLVSYPSGADGGVVIQRVADGQEVARLGKASRGMSYAFSPDNQLFAAGKSGLIGTAFVDVWRLPSGE